MMPCSQKDVILHADIDRFASVLPYAPDFDLMTALSGLTYERKTCFSHIVFVPPQSCFPLNYITEFHDAVYLCPENERLIRKRLQSAGKDHCLICTCDENGYRVSGVQTVPEDIKDYFVYSIRFVDHMYWEFSIGEKTMFYYKFGYFFNAKSDDIRGMIRSYFQAVFEDPLPEEAECCFADTVRQLVAEHTGTSFVFIEQGAYRKEVDRLVNTAHSGVPVGKANIFRDSDREFFTLNARADGGFLLDQCGNCCSVNVIFDGRTDMGKDYISNPAFGARHNSLSLYLSNMLGYRYRIFAVIISEDGQVSFMPAKN